MVAWFLFGCDFVLKSTFQSMQFPESAGMSNHKLLSKWEGGQASLNLNHFACPCHLCLPVIGRRFALFFFWIWLCLATVWIINELRVADSPSGWLRHCVSSGWAPNSAIAALIFVAVLVHWCGGGWPFTLPLLLGPSDSDEREMVFLIPMVFFVPGCSILAGLVPVGFWFRVWSGWIVLRSCRPPAAMNRLERKHKMQHQNQNKTTRPTNHPNQSKNKLPTKQQMKKNKNKKSANKSEPASQPTSQMASSSQQTNHQHTQPNKRSQQTKKTTNGQTKKRLKQTHLNRNNQTNSFFFIPSLAPRKICSTFPRMWSKFFVGTEARCKVEANRHSEKRVKSRNSENWVCSVVICQSPQKHQVERGKEEVSTPQFNSKNNKKNNKPNPVKNRWTNAMNLSRTIRTSLQLFCSRLWNHGCGSFPFWIPLLEAKS